MGQLALETFEMQKRFKGFYFFRQAFRGTSELYTDFTPLMLR